MNAAWMPLLIGALGIVGAAATYAYQKRVDRRTALVEIRRSVYRDYLNAFMAMSDSPERIESIRRQYYQNEVQLLSSAPMRSFSKSAHFLAFMSIQTMIVSIAMPLRSDG